MAHDLYNPETTLARRLQRNTFSRSEKRVPVFRLERLRAEIQQTTYHVSSEALMRSMLRTNTVVN